MTALWSLSHNYPVIPNVSIIRWSINLLFGLIGSLEQTYIFTWFVYLVIRQKYILILVIQMFGSILPLFFFVTILKKFIPNKIATDYCLKYSIICVRMNSISLLLLILSQLKHSVYTKPLNRKAIVRYIEGV